MGCGQSNMRDHLVIEGDGTASSLNRKEKKRQKFKVNFPDSVSTENVMKSPDNDIEDEDLKMLEETFQHHYLFCKLKEGQRKQMIGSINVYVAFSKQIIFQKGDPASLFFVIKSGRVTVEVNGKQKILERGDCFGQLALLYKAPRSATIIAQQDCTFLCLSHDMFRKISQEMIKKNFEMAKLHIEKASIFKYLSTKERNVIAYNAYTLRFEKDSIIFKEGDDANSFFIVIKGKVEIQIPGKKNIIMSTGDSFGENSFESYQVRSGTAKAIENTDILGIGGYSLKKYLGTQLRDLTFYNIMKWSLQRHNLFSWMSEIEIQKIISISQIKKYKNSQVICESGSIAKSIVICLQQKINNQEVGSLFNCQYILCSDSQTDLRITTQLIKVGAGNIALLPFASINKILGKSIDILMTKPLPKQQLVSFEETRNQYIKSLKLKDLTIRYKLGEGQFGKVFCAEDKFKKVYALKCISKKKTIENNMEEFIVHEKQILESIEFGFINKLYSTYHDDYFVYFLLKYIDGGDFFHILRHIGLCNKATAQFYFGCYILAIQYLHSKNIVYRDLKPENAVIDKKGFLSLIDLGTAKILKEENGYRTFTIVGTPHYMAPQVSEGQGYTFSADIWSLGVILFEMLCGQLPYANDLDDPYEILNAISSGEDPDFPSFYKDTSGIYLITELLKRDPADRHVESFVKIKNTSFFQDFKWQLLEKKALSSPFKVNREKLNVAIDKKFNDYYNQSLSIKEKPPKSDVQEWNELFQ